VLKGRGGINIYVPICKTLLLIGLSLSQ